MATSLSSVLWTPRLRRREKQKLASKIKYNHAQVRVILQKMENSATIQLNDCPDFVRKFVKDDWLTEEEAAWVLWKSVLLHIVKLLMESDCEG
jgi:hypothetical protein